MRQSTKITKYPNRLTLSTSEISQYKPSKGNNSPKSKRGKITSFTPSAQKSLKKQWGKIDFAPYYHQDPHQPSGRGFLLSLTWPHDADYGALKPREIRRKVSRALDIEFKQVYQGAIWKQELQLNGTLHIHIVLFFSETQETADLHEICRDLWTRATDKHEPDYRRDSIDVQTLYGEPGLFRLRNYLQKQPTHPGQIWEHGAIWNTFYPDRLPVGHTQSYTLQDREQYGDTAAANSTIMLGVLKTHPATRDHPKVKILNLDWRGWSLDLPPAVLAEVWMIYEHKLAEQ